MKIRLWMFQMVFGLFLIGIFVWVKYTIPNLVSNFDSYLLIGIGGTCLIWGIREVIGALRLQYLCRRADSI